MEAGFIMSRQKVHPRGCNCLVIKTTEVVVLRKRLNSAAHAFECYVERLPLEMQPGEPKVVGMAKLRSPQAAGVERLQEFVVTQVGRCKHERHKPIMAD